MDRLAVLDLTVTGTSPGRFDPDGYELSGLLRGLRRQSQDFLKGYVVRNHMIGRKDKHGCGMIASGHPTCAECNRRSGIAFGGFCHDILLGNEMKQLFRSGPTTQWPKALTAATGENERVNRIDHVDAKNQR